MIRNKMGQDAREVVVQEKKNITIKGSKVRQEEPWRW